MVALKLVLFFMVALALLSYIGYGPARLLLRGPLARFRLIFLPLMGVCTVIVLSSFLNSTLFPMGAATWIILGLATGMNALLLLRTRTLGLPRPTPRAAAIGVLMLVSYGLGILPLLHANTTAFLGVQWDLEIYLPLTEYLKRYAVGGELLAPANPLLESLNSAPVRGGSGWGFSYVEALLSTVLGWPSFETFRPTLQFIFSLSVPAVYFFCRAGLKMGPAASLLAAGLAGVNGLNLWLASVGLAGHTLTFMTLPLALTTSMWALRERSPATVLLAGLVVAAMLLSFYTGAALLYGVALVLVGLLYLARGPRRAQLLVVGVGLVASTALFGLIAHLRFLELLPTYFQQGFTGGWHVQRFSPLSEGLGLTPFLLVTDRLGDGAVWNALPGAGTEAWGIVLGLAAGLFCLAALARREWDRGVFLSIAAAFGALALYLRFGADYPYGYFKLLSLSSFLLLAGLAQGLVTAWRWSGSTASKEVPPEHEKAPLSRTAARGRFVIRGTALVCSLLFLPLLAVNTALSIQFFWEPDPAELPRSVWELQQLRTLVPAGAPVYLAGRSRFDPRVAAMVSYFLIDNPLVGNITTAYGHLRSRRPDERYRYLLLQSGERPEERGLRSSDLVWGNDLAALYLRPSRWLTAVDLESTDEAIPLEPRVPLALHLSPTGWSLSNGREHLRGTFNRRESPQQVELSLLTFGEATATLRLPDGERRVTLPPGLVSYRTPPLSLPGILGFSLEEAQQPAWLLGMRVLRSEDPAPALAESQELLLLQPRSDIQGAVAELALDYRLVDARGGSVALAVEVYRRSPQGRALKPEAFWHLARRHGSGGGRASFALDLASWTCGAAPSALHPASTAPPIDGTYEAHLAVYYVNEEVLRWPWLTFTAHSGRITQLKQSQIPPYAVQYLPVPREVISLGQTLPENARIYVPPFVDPDSSFIPVTVAALAEHRFFADEPRHLPGARPGEPGVVYPYALLPAGEAPEPWGFDRAQRLWANDRATLYHRSGGTSQLDPAQRPRSTSRQVYLEAEARLEGSTARVAIHYPGPRPEGEVLGLDIYGERPCELLHYGWWATPTAQLPETAEIALDLPRQRGRIQDSAGNELATGKETWSINDGLFRAFLVLKQGDRFVTTPVFEFTLEQGNVTDFRSFPVKKRATLTP